MITLVITPFTVITLIVNGTTLFSKKFSDNVNKITKKTTKKFNSIEEVKQYLKSINLSAGTIQIIFNYFDRATNPHRKTCCGGKRKLILL